MLVATKHNRSEEKENLSILAAEGPIIKRVRQRAPRACLNCRDLKVSTIFLSFIEEGY